MQLEIILAVVAVVGTIAGIAWWFSPDQRAKRAMKSVARTTIKDAPDGEKVRVTGRVECDAPLYAPLSGRACAAWRVIVREKRGKHTYTLVDDSEVTAFRLVDGDDRAHVDESYVKVVLDEDASGSTGLFGEPPPELVDFLADRGHSTQGFFLSKTLWYREGVAEIDETVAVMGLARWEADPEKRAQAAGYRTVSQPERLVLCAPDDGPLLMSDHHDVVR
ncbi:MAG: hypothetical protein AB7S26_21835 [Sandaracinaceae bacterium]